MGRKLSKGSVELKGGVWRALITFPRNAQRPKRIRVWHVLDGCRTESEARRRALSLGKLARDGKIAPPDKRHTHIPMSPSTSAQHATRLPHG
jgi:hypothetical protein